VANLGIPIFRRSAWGLDVPAHSRFETDDRTPPTWEGSNLYVHPMLADPTDAAAEPFDFGDNANKAIRVNVVAGGVAGGTSSVFGAPFPASGTAAGALDVGGDMAALNLDATGNLRVVMPAGAGGLTDAELRAAPVPISVAALPLPAGAATEATLATRASEATLAGVLTTAAFQARINTLGQKAMAASTPVVLASDQSAIPVTGTFFQATQPVSVAALPLPAGAATEATLSAMSAKLPAALVGGRLDTNIGAWLGSVAPTVGQKVMAFSLPVVLASDQPAVAVSLGTHPDLVAAAPTAAAVGVASGAVIAANANRKGLVLTVTTPGRRVSFGLDGAPAVLDSGITLYGPGGVWKMDKETFTTGEVRGISDVAATNVAIEEFA
jgi:hypothetical protein